MSCDSRHPRQTEAVSATMGISAEGGAGLRTGGFLTTRATGFLLFFAFFAGGGVVDAADAQSAKAQNTDRPAQR